MSDFDVIVAGRGPAGLSAACLIADGGMRVALIGNAHAAVDPRTVALMQPSIRLLESMGIWPGTLASEAAPLRRLRLVDDTGSPVKAPELVFDAREIGEDAFGWNIPLALLVPALEARVAALGVTVIDDKVIGADQTGATIAVETDSGRRLTARLAIAADGRDSVLREAAGIRVNSWGYDQVAVATSFAHTGHHQFISTEYHKEAGPCTTVPMPGRRSALVWMERPDRAAALMSLPDAALARDIQLATHGELGRISDIGPRRAFVMKGLAARAFSGNRVMLVGEAAHVVPPIGAQGLNMSLRDAAWAADIIHEADDPGGEAALQSYDARRRRDVQPRQQAIDLMNRSLLSGFLPFQGARALGLAAIAGFPPLRRFVMQHGIGTALDLPEAMAARRAG